MSSTRQKRILKLTWIMVMAVAVLLSIIQLNIPVVRAAGCDSCPSGGPCCMLDACTTVTVDGTSWTTCYYTCSTGCGSGEEHMTIEQEEGPYT